MVVKIISCESQEVVVVVDCPNCGPLLAISNIFRVVIMGAQEGTITLTTYQNIMIPRFARSPVAIQFREC